MRNDGGCEQYTVGIKLLSPGDTYTTRIIVEYYSGRYSIPGKDLDVVRPEGKGFINQLVADYQPTAQPSLRDSEPPQSTPESGSREII